MGNANSGGLPRTRSLTSMVKKSSSGGSKGKKDAAELEMGIKGRSESEMSKGRAESEMLVAKTSSTSSKGRTESEISATTKGRAESEMFAKTSSTSKARAESEMHGGKTSKARAETEIPSSGSSKIRSESSNKTRAESEARTFTPRPPLMPKNSTISLDDDWKRMSSSSSSRRASIHLHEAWYDNAYTRKIHLGKSDGSMTCPNCRLAITSNLPVSPRAELATTLAISSPPSMTPTPTAMTPAQPPKSMHATSSPKLTTDDTKFVTCTYCQMKWPFVVARMIPKIPGGNQWVRDVDYVNQSYLCWARMLKESEEARLQKLLETFLILDREDLEARLVSLQSPFLQNAPATELALQLATATAWQTREFSHVAFCRRFLPNGLLEWQPASENCLETQKDPKELGILPEEICEIRHGPLGDKITWFKAQVERLRSPGARGANPPGSGALRVSVRRDCVLEDASTCFLTMKPQDLWRTTKYEFIDELAIDAGGLAREFFTLVGAQAFNASFGLFEAVHAEDGLLSYRINLNSGLANELHLQYFRFVGRFLAKALIDGYNIPCHLTRDLYKHMVGEPISIDDVSLIDPQLGKSMLHVLECEDVGALCLDFTTSVWGLGKTNQVDLIENGSQTNVTGDNVEKYLSLLLRFVMLDRHHLQLSFFLKGFEEVVPQSLISVFTASEFEGVISGLDFVDVDDWMKHCVYRGKFLLEAQAHPVIGWFWTHIRNMDQPTRGKFLQFCTASSRVPVQGFKALTGDDGLEMWFSIEAVSLERCIYPRAHTCFNRLELPLYTSEADLIRYVDEAVGVGLVGFNMDE